MDTIIADGINNFPYGENVSLEDQLITLTYAQLQDLVVRAVQEGIQPLQDEVAQLREDIIQSKKDLAESQLFFGRELAHMRQRMSKIEHKEPLDQTVKPYLDKIAARLMDLRIAGRPPAMSYREVAALLGLTRGRVSQLQPVIAQDGRFRIEAKGRKKLICLSH